MRLSLVVGLYNMQREIPRSLHTMSPEVQGLAVDDYEIIVVDNGSSARIDPNELTNIAANARYVFVDDAAPSPTDAINRAVAESRGEIVTVVIDGARMFSPGVLSRTLQAFDVFDEPFVYAPSLHLGSQLQNDSAFGGYDQAAEDLLLGTVDWERDPYELFAISNVEAVPERLMMPTFESNCFSVRRETWDRLGGYHPGFGQSRAGGIANWEIFARYIGDESITPVLLLGEATFHQFHGGASTNQPRAHHPIRTWLQEHRDIFGVPYAWPEYQPVIFGEPTPPVLRSLFARNLHANIDLIRRLGDAGNHDAAIAIGGMLHDRFPNDPAKLQLLAETLERAGRRAEALVSIGEAIAIAPTQAELHVTQGIIQIGLGDYPNARSSYDTAVELDDLLAEAYFHRAHLLLREHHIDAAIEDFVRAIACEPHPPAHYESDLEQARQLQSQPTPEAVSAPDSSEKIHDRFLTSVREHYADALDAALLEEHALGGSFSEAELRVLASWVAKTRPTRALVVGGFLGLSTREIFEQTADVGTTIVSIDPNLRHRIFDAPLDHARHFVSSDRVQFLDGFFAARTDSGSQYDLREFEPKHDDDAIRTLIDEARIVEPIGEFDFVLIDGDEGSELVLAAAAVRFLGPEATVVLRGAQHGHLGDLISFGLPGSAIETVPIDDRPGFVIVSSRP